MFTVRCPLSSDYNEVKFVRVSKSCWRSGPTVLVDRKAINGKETEGCIHGTFTQLHRPNDSLRGFLICLHDLFSILRTVYRGPANVGFHCGVSNIYPGCKTDGVLGRDGDFAELVRRFVCSGIFSGVFGDCEQASGKNGLFDSIRNSVGIF